MCLITQQQVFEVCGLMCLHSFIGSGAVALAHLDGVSVEEAITTMVNRVQELAMGFAEGRIEVQLVGGYSDPNHYSEDLFYNIMSKYLKFLLKHMQLLSSRLEKFFSPIRLIFSVHRIDTTRELSLNFPFTVKSSIYVDYMAVSDWKALI